MIPPKVFISYSHDSIEHKAWVLQLGTMLIENGINAIIDQWDINPGGDIPMFIEKNLDSADYILMICSNNYVIKANEGKGGVGYEKMIITSSFMDRIDEAKVIPIIRQNGSQNVPIFLKTKMFIDLSMSANFDEGVSKLIRKIHNYPVISKPNFKSSLPASTLRPTKPTNMDISDFGRRRLSGSGIILRITIGFATLSSITGVLAWLIDDRDFLYGCALVSGVLSFICFIAYLISLVRGR